MRPRNAGYTKMRLGHRVDKCVVAHRIVLGHDLPSGVAMLIELSRWLDHVSVMVLEKEPAPHVKPPLAFGPALELLFLNQSPVR